VPEYEGVEHEGVEHEGVEYEGVDALLAAVTDEPLPEGARHDARFMAEHRSAVADVALLREQLRMMGDALAGEAPVSGGRASRTGAGPGSRPGPTAGVPSRAPAPRWPPKEAGPRRPRRYRRFAGTALGTLAVTAGTALLGGLVWLGTQGGSDGTAPADASAEEESGAGSSAHAPGMDPVCAKVLAEGTVRSITPAEDGNVNLVLEVERYYRPEQSVADHPTIAVTLPPSARGDLRTGTYTLVRVPVHATDRPDWETGPGIGEVREEILAGLPEARGLKCAGPQADRG